ncbi:hypothetical protein MNV49_000651 [Pseudohyphozyma bogoriensis]|nr:hypothetical protein MNV49_000651 [Pseudohyphozyma bogoriensis]
MGDGSVTKCQSMLLYGLSFIALVATIGVVGALPAGTSTLHKRLTNSDVITEFNALQTKFESAGTDISNALSSVDTSDGTAVVAAVSGILTEMETDLTSATTNLGLSSSQKMLLTRQSDSNLTEVAEAIANAITAFVTALEELESLIDSNSTLGELLIPFFTDLDLDLAVILSGLGLVLAGVLALVSDLLSDLGSALSGLGFSSTLSTLGL